MATGFTFRYLRRRDILKGGLAAAGSLAAPGLVAPLVSSVRADDAQPTLVIARGTPPPALVEEALKQLGGMERFVNPGDVVVVKPNMAWDREPQYAANTNPEVVAVLVKLCLQAGAGTVKVFDRAVNDPRRCYRQSGIAEAAENAGAEVSFIDDRKFVDIDIGGLALRSWPFYRDILEADKVINVPIAKTHGQSRLTLGLKNWLGVVGGWRGRLHQRLNESIVDIASVVRPELTIIDAIRILVANGPQGGRLEDVRTTNTIIAGTDPVAADAAATSLFGMIPGDLPYLRMAQDAGLGRMEVPRHSLVSVEL